MKLGFIGLGKMGSRMVLKLLEEGHEVVVWNRSKEPVAELKTQIAKLPTSLKLRGASKTASQNLKASETIENLVQYLEKPRVIWSMVPAGEATSEVLKEVQKYVEPDDIVIDGGNSYFKDTDKRYEEFKKNGIKFLGIGVSGGIIAAKNGYPLMVGGDKSAFEHVRPILESLSKPHGGFAYFGEGGAGHFVKMVHNGMEYGIMQSLGEGFEVLEKSPYDLNLLEVAKLYQKGTLVSGFMMDRVADSLEEDPTLSKIDGVIGSASQETNWMIEQAKEEQVPIEIIEASVEYRKRSQTDSKVSNSFTARLVSALRKSFGGHEVKSK